MEKPFGEKKGQLPTLGSEEAIAGADLPDVRMFKVARTKAAQPADDVTGSWVRSSPASILSTQFSAAAWFFGRKLKQELGSPVGLIDATWGGTRIESWTPPDLVQPAYTPKMEAMIQGWRRAFGSELPFHYVQLAPTCIRWCAPSRSSTAPNRCRGCARRRPTRCGFRTRR